jgi:hypothetical protein
VGVLNRVSKSQRASLCMLTALLLSSSSCKSDRRASTSDSPSVAPPASQVAATQEFCGRTPGARRECAGQLETDWASMTGDSFHVATEKFMKRLGYGRLQPRLPRAQGGSKVPSIVAPLDDADTIQPNYIGSPVVFAMMLPLTGAVEKRFGLDGSNSASYWMVLDPSPKADSSTWTLVRLHKTGGNWAFTTSSRKGQWTTCTKTHKTPAFPYADFMTCDQAAELPLSLFADATTLKELAKTVNLVGRTGDEPVWIFCPAGCCEASY